MSERSSRVVEVARLPLLGGLVLTLLLAVSAWLALDYQSRTSRPQHSIEVRRAIAGVLSTVERSESSQRSYLLTRDDSLLAGYTTAGREIAPQLGKLEGLVRDDPAQLGGAHDLRSAAEARLRSLASTLAAAQSRGPAAAAVELKTLRGLRAMARLRQVAAVMQAREDRLLAERSATARRTGYLLLGVIVTGVGLTALLLAAWRRAALASARLLAAANEDLERTVAARTRALEASTRFVELILSSATDYAIVTIDLQGRVTSWNAGAEAVFGWTHEDMIGRDLGRLFTAEDRETGRIERQRREARALGAARDDYWRLRKDGARFWASGEMQPMRDAGGREVGFLEIVRDRTEVRGAQDALEASRARLQAVLDTVPVGVITAEAPSGRILDGNVQIEAILGHPVLFSPNAESYGEWIAFHEDGRTVQAHEYPLAKAIAGAPRAELECRYQRGDGRLAWVRFIAAPILDAAGAIVGGVVASLDIDREKRAEEALRLANATLEQDVARRTEELTNSNRQLVGEMARREAAEDQIRQLQKMEAIGQLTGGIAHDFNNMLAVVLGGLTLMQRRMAAGDVDVGKYVDAALESANRAATLTKRLLDFSRQQTLSPQPLDANRLIGGMSDLLRRTLGEQIRLETVFAGGLWRTHADLGQLENAVLNLAVNARDAMEAAGRLTIETSNAALDDGYVQTQQGVSAGQYVLIAVTDTGGGMAPEVAAKAFDPFFTTKGVGRGTGLGLSQVYGFVKQSGGHVKIYSELGQGTTVKLYLPRFYGAGDEAPAAGYAPRAELPLGGVQEVVLVVEDEPRVRELSVDALRELGYTVIHADGAVSALRQLDAHPEVTLLFTDVVMPDVNGRKLADEALRRRPALKVLFTTGFTRNAVVHNEVLDAGTNLLPKPFTLEQLATKVRAVIAS